MRYSDDRRENEKSKHINGERSLVTSEMLGLFVGSDNENEEIREMLLDILNNQYPIYNAIQDIRNYYEELQM